jgi:hypothetical protein|tara:strand:- start:38878 stop:39477 length:600 start_codon:yes stop_codon:yes gene_type:complete
VLNKILVPSVYFGPIEYYKFLSKHNNICIEVQEHYIKQTIRNRCHISSANGKLRLTVPVTKTNHTKIKNIKICYKQNWIKNHWYSIKSSYGSSPYFLFYENEIFNILQKHEKYLIDLNTALQNKIFEILDINPIVKYTKDYNNDEDIFDLRNHSFLNNNIKPYNQVFMHKFNFIPDLSILDLIFNLGPQSTKYLIESDM